MLTATALYQAEEEYSVEASNVYLMSPTYSVFEVRTRVSILTQPETNRIVLEARN